MTSFLLWAGPAALSAIVARRAGAEIVRRSPLLRKNYRGLEVPAGLGVAVMLGMLAGLALVAVAHGVAGDAPGAAAAAGVSPYFLAAALGFGLLGLWDDVSAAPERGMRAHARSLRRGALTSGAMKLAGGAALGYIVASPISDGFWWSLGNGAIVALSANLHNLLDVRPGRAAKAFALGAVPLLVIGGPTAPAIAATLGAVVAVFPLDVRERGMLGDAGANAIGAVVGLSVVALGANWARLLALGLLAVLHLAAEGPTLSRGIDALPPLRALDRAGRVPEES